MAEAEKEFRRRVTGPVTWCRVEMMALLVTGARITERASGNIAEITVQTHAPWHPALPPEKINVIVSGKAVAYVSKAKWGDVLRIEGYLQTFIYEDPTARDPRYIKKVIADFIHVCSGQGNFIADIENVIAENTH